MATTAIRILVVDDHPVIRDGVAAQIGRSQSLTIAGFANSASAAVEAAARVEPDVILLDLRLADQLATEIIPRLRADHPLVRIVLFTAYPEHAAVRVALTAGADGVLMKDAGQGDLVHALLTVAKTGRLPYSVPATTAAGELIPPREYEVLRRVAMGQSNPEIAVAMSISRNTVKSYLRSVLRKLVVRNRVEAIARARELGLL